MANNCHIEYASCMMIAVPLDATCSIVEDAPTFVSAGFTEINGEWEREEGTDYSAKNAAGQLCGPDLKGPDVDKWINLSGTLCLMDWGLLAMATGNPLTLNAGGDVVGYGERVTPPTAPCAVNVQPRFALAVITRSATGDGVCDPSGGADGATECLLHVYPLVTNFKHSAPSHKDERRMVEFTARAYNNPNILRGPWNLYPAANVPDTIPGDLAHWEGFIPCTGLPTPGCDPQDHPAPLPAEEP